MKKNITHSNRTNKDKAAYQVFIEDKDGNLLRETKDIRRQHLCKEPICLAWHSAIGTDRERFNWSNKIFLFTTVA